MNDRETIITRLHETRKYLEDKEWSDRMASPHIDNINDAIELLKEQQETIELQGSLLTLAHAAMTHGKKEGLTNGARPGRNRENPASHV